MGEPVRIADVAQVLAARANRPVSIQYTGLRGGEKLHEVLLGGGEEDQRPMHPLISHVAAAPLDPRLARSIDIYAHPRVVVTSLAKICAEGAQVPADG
jgi:FlaA1/EpsC-like NDP-sugar epimerase